MARSIDIDWIRIDGGTQPRAQLSLETVDEYAESIESLPPVVVFFDGTEYWLADGFHRYHAHRKAGAVQIGVKVEKGTQRDAILYAVGANASHGLRRTNDDKRHSVMMLLRDKEWVARSNRWVAEKCGVSDTFVADVKREEVQTDRTSVVTGKDGKSYPAPKKATPPSPVQPTRTEAQAPIPQPRRAEAPAAVEDNEEEQEEVAPTEPTASAFDEIEERFRTFGVVSDLRKKWPDSRWPAFIEVLEMVIEETRNAMC
jgi:uncharacterized ParB-like nuclease family protein